ncbi:MAG: carboxypeptidase regulatory-like domain-containing protein [Planctomycetota bacterium]
MIFDVLLRERLGGERPPMSTDRILARFARGDGAAAARQVVVDTVIDGGGRRSRWLAAAIVLLGAGVVVATRVWADPAGGGGERPSVVQDPQPAPRDHDARSAAGFALRVVDGNGGPVQICTLDIVQEYRAPGGGAGGSAVLARTSIRDLALQPRDFAADGFAAIRGLSAGRFRAVVRAEGFVLALSAPFDLVADAPLPAVTVHLDQGGELSGRIVDRAGRAVGGAVVATALPPDGLERNSPVGAMFADQFLEVRTRASVQTASDGTFRLTRLVPGAYWLAVDHPVHGARTVTGVAVAAGRQELPPIELEPAVEILGRVVDGGGAAAPGAEVLVVHRASGQRWTATTDATGAFRIRGGLVAGDYELRAAAAASQGLVKMMQLANSSTALAIPADASEVSVEVVLR